MIRGPPQIVQKCPTGIVTVSRTNIVPRTHRHALQDLRQLRRRDSLRLSSSDHRILKFCTSEEAFQPRLVAAAKLQEEAPQMLDTFPSFKVSPGLAHPLGVSETESGINFAIFSRHASAVTLCIILPKSVHDGMIELALDPQKNRTGDIWHICIKELPQGGVLYGYRIDGPRNWHEGHRFDDSIILVDPYAKLIEGRRVFGDESNKMCRFFGTYDFNSLPFDWGENYKLPNIPEVD